jgi:serine/threonine-protein kinase
MADAAGEEFLRSAAARVGRTLRGKFRLDRLLGVGGTAAVYEATHREGQRYAIKVLHPQLMIDASIRQRFFREGYVVNRIDHSGVVKIIDDDIDDDGALFLVMDLLEGESIESRAQRSGGRLPPGEVLYIAHRALDVLHAAHAAGVVHRDLKPDNLFLARPGEIKVLDFGIARLFELGARSMTRTGVVMGTPAFMPPEQARGRWAEVDARSDVWALGATMFALLTGRLVHEARTINELLLAAMTAAAAPVRALAPEVGVALAGVVDRALARDKASRFPHARAMQEAARHAMIETRAWRARRPSTRFARPRPRPPRFTTENGRSRPTVSPERPEPRSDTLIRWSRRTLTSNEPNLG